MTDTASIPQNMSESVDTAATLLQEIREPSPATDGRTALATRVEDAVTFDNWSNRTSSLYFRLTSSAPVQVTPTFEDIDGEPLRIGTQRSKFATESSLRLNEGVHELKIMSFGEYWRVPAVIVIHLGVVLDDKMYSAIKTVRIVHVQTRIKPNGGVEEVSVTFVDDEPKPVDTSAWISSSVAKTAPPKMAAVAKKRTYAQIATSAARPVKKKTTLPVFRDESSSDENSRETADESGSEYANEKKRSSPTSPKTSPATKKPPPAKRTVSFMMDTDADTHVPPPPPVDLQPVQTSDGRSLLAQRRSVATNASLLPPLSLGQLRDTLEAEDPFATKGSNIDLEKTHSLEDQEQKLHRELQAIQALVNHKTARLDAIRRLIDVNRVLGPLGFRVSSLTSIPPTTPLPK